MHDMHTASARSRVHETHRAGLEPVLIYCSMHTTRVAIRAAQNRRIRCVCREKSQCTPNAISDRATDPWCKD